MGTPDQVREALLARARHAGADELMVTTNVHDPAERRHSYALLADAFGLGTALDDPAPATRRPVSV